MRLSSLLSFLRHGARGGCVTLLAASLPLLGCDRPTEPGSNGASSSSASTMPREGVDVEAGTDVTGQPGQHSVAPIDDRPLIVAFGDSLTAGLGIAPNASYPAQLQRRLDQSGYRFRVVNAGVSGETSAGGLRRVEWVLRSHPRIVILEFGGNDGLRGLAVSQTKANLEEMIVRFQQAGVKVILAGMQLPPNYGTSYTDQFARLYRELAQTHQVTLMPFFLEGVAAQPTLNQADGIHPTEAGYRIVVDHVLGVLRPLLDVISEGRQPAGQDEKKRTHETPGKPESSRVPKI